ncbi:DUF4064 domain-containing protein [Aquibacillus rhizosphaerae]|uniref:DUF4064 domain-containing protein n=1 Tax=Aquibacillus rhizosphaerae TaxID=3051431 RepID=A0ABT7L6R6_9BACI|nr:DUF4064 domain-containing protein [Aquibacillus sp. LR5S19]MDL4841099.1 DUF4064 domain-containing protein [Aquibacillus sp. LR5S19]
MIKRTGEVVLGVIGALFYGIMAGVGGFLVALQGNDEIMSDFVDEMVATDPNLTQADFEGFLDGFTSISWLILISAILAIVLGIIAMILLKGNKKPKVAGIILIVTAVVVSFSSLGLGIFAGIFYLIAGIMSLVRKPRQLIE